MGLTPPDLPTVSQFTTSQSLQISPSGRVVCQTSVSQRSQTKLARAARQQPLDSEDNPDSPCGRPTNLREEAVVGPIPLDRPPRQKVMAMTSTEIDAIDCTKRIFPFSAGEWYTVRDLREAAAAILERTASDQDFAAAMRVPDPKLYPWSKSWMEEILPAGGWLANSPFRTTMASNGRRSARLTLSSEPAGRPSKYSALLLTQKELAPSPSRADTFAASK